MKNAIIDKLEKSRMKTKVFPFKVGDTVRVHVRIVEGNKERIQIFEGTCIARDGGGISESFTVRKVVGHIGVEKKFLLHSPRLIAVEMVRSGSVRRAKLFYLRDRVGSRALRIKEEEQLAEEILASQEEVKQYLIEQEKLEKEAREKRHAERAQSKEKKAGPRKPEPAAAPAAPAKK